MNNTTQYSYHTATVCVRTLYLNVIIVVLCVVCAVPDCVLCTVRQCMVLDIIIATTSNRVC